MKNLFLSTGLFLICFCTISAQTTKELFSLPGMRISYLAQDDASYLFERSYFYVGDTILNGRHVIKYLPGHRKAATYLSIIGGKVIEIVPPEYGYYEERLLFDFDLEVGDTINVREWQNYIVAEKDTVQLSDGLKRRAIRMEGYNEYNWIEGIGDLRHPLDGFSNIDYSYYLACAEAENGLYLESSYPSTAAYCSKFSCFPLGCDIEYTKDDNEFILSYDNKDVTEYLWSFPDGTTSDEANPTYKIETPGCYQITLTVNNSCDDRPFELTKNVSYCQDQLLIQKNKLPDYLGKILIANELEGYGISSTSKQLLRTSDGGSEWEEIDFPYLDAYQQSTAGRIKNFAIAEDSILFVSFSDTISRVVKTDDEGENWSEIYSSDCSGGVVIKEGRLFKSSSACSRVSYSDDYGDSWSSFELPEEIDFPQLQILSAHEIIVLDSDLSESTFWKTDDLGLSWEAFSVVNKEIKNFVFLSALEGFVFSKGTISKTIDGGRTWVDTNNPDIDAIVEFGFKDAQLGWVIGRTDGVRDGGVILETNDGGNSWAKINCETTINPWDMHIAEDSIYFLLGRTHLYSYRPDLGLECLPSSVDDEIENGTLLLYPQPSSGMLYFSEPIASHTDIKVIDPAGEIVCSKSNITSIEHLDLSFLDSGLYIINLTEQGQPSKAIRIVIIK